MQLHFTAPAIECDGCAGSIKRVLARLDGVESVDVDVATKQVTVSVVIADSAPLIEGALTKAGFPPEARA